MYYQLPSGKVVSISIDDFLTMSDHEIQQLSNGGYGGDIQDPFIGSTIESKKKKKATPDLDYEQEYEDPTKDPVLRIPDESEREYEEDLIDLEDSESAD